MRQVTHKEKHLYRCIQELLERRFAVWAEATVRAGDTGTRTADHVAWKWDGDRIEAFAVEVKKGTADKAIAQAVAYQVGFPQVYIAAETLIGEMGYLAKVIARLGLGYIHVQGQGASAEIEQEAGPSLFLSSGPHYENVAHPRQAFVHGRADR